MSRNTREMRYAGMVRFPLAAAGLSRVAGLCPFMIPDRNPRIEAVAQLPKELCQVGYSAHIAHDSIV
jgi:hypothetical protein